jgi:hypothetical protein
MGHKCEGCSQDVHITPERHHYLIVQNTHTDIQFVFRVRLQASMDGERLQT